MEQKHITVEMIAREAAKMAKAAAKLAREQEKQKEKERKAAEKVENAFRVYAEACEAAINGDWEYFLRTSNYTINKAVIAVNDYMSGKMKGIPCISTHAALNSRCMKNAADPDKRNICTHCYAEATLNMYDSLSINMAKNTAILNSCIIPAELLPVFGNVGFARIEPFGDLETVRQAINYINIIKKNPTVTFAWWTKNADILAEALEKTGGKPANAILIYSSQYINQPADISKYPFFDKVFTVWDKRENCEAAGMHINCRATVDGNEVNSCVMCRKCYTLGNTCKYVNELQK